ncbi:hypothetical protein [Desulfobacula sp.]|uniref:hypothetical protein n=1 Tax=Desulfobacula sp. TaxID=2593537 RepID=UPI002617AE51|nr:hypothetical protein [Desulfobacula sp.]
MGHKTDNFNQADLQDRRRNQDRRAHNDRRSKTERRYDFRDNPNGQRKSIRIWLRSIIKSRLGVDRRKNNRRYADRRRRHKSDILTQEEITDLLSL